MNRRSFLRTTSSAGGSLLASRLCFAASPEAGSRLFGLPLSSTAPIAAADTLEHFGIPYLKGTLKAPIDAPLQLPVDAEVSRIFLLGMTESARISGWSDPSDYTRRYFIGETLGHIGLEYADGVSDTFPLILGQSLWWAPPFNRFQEPFPGDTQLRQAFNASLRLFPAAPVDDGTYAAVILPRSAAIKVITLQAVTTKQGQPVIAGITLETTPNTRIPSATLLNPRKPSAGPIPAIAKRPLRRAGEHEHETETELKNLKLAVYSSDESFHGPVTHQPPPSYSGPSIAFRGNLTADVLTNAFSWNVQDMLDKIDPDGMYHTSTRGALWWNDGGLGSEHTGKYYPQSWSRDLGRSLQELCELGCLEKARACADFCFRMARLWEQDATLMVRGQHVPAHWGRMINQPDDKIAFENDGHALISMFLYKLWQRLPDRDAWLRSHWPDVKAAGDWILWQFANPELSGASNGLLRTTGESANGSGYSAYPDCACLNALRALAQMADSIGQTDSAAAWRERATDMQSAIGSQYIVADARYGRTWTLEHAGWPYKSTVLGPLVLLADYKGFALHNDNDPWHTANTGAYQRLIDTYQPFGFYGLTMGYGQGFVTQSALLLDRMRDVSVMLDWLARQIYDPRLGSFIVSEGVQIDPTGKFWYRFGDLGNGVQEAEIVKVLRLIIGIDDTNPQRLQFYPRMPFGWGQVAVSKYPVLIETAGALETIHINYKLSRVGEHLHLDIASEKPLPPISTRLGPFPAEPQRSSIRVNGKTLSDTSVQKSGDSWWVSCSVNAAAIS